MQDEYYKVVSIGTNIDDVGWKRGYSWNILHWSKFDFKSRICTNGDYFFHLAKHLFWISFFLFCSVFNISFSTWFFSHQVINQSLFLLTGIFVCFKLFCKPVLFFKLLDFFVAPVKLQILSLVLGKTPFIEQSKQS